MVVRIGLTKASRGGSCVCCARGRVLLAVLPHAAQREEKEGDGGKALVAGRDDDQHGVARVAESGRFAVSSV